jgi:hypothetical protein
MKILFNCYANNENFDGCQYALIELSDEAKKEIIARRELFQMVKSKDSGLWSLTFWDAACEFYDYDDWAPEDAFTDEQAKRFEAQGYLVLPDDFEESEADAARTECDRMVVTADSVYWKCIAKHTDVYVETRQLPYEVLL